MRRFCVGQQQLEGMADAEGSGAVRGWTWTGALEMEPAACSWEEHRDLRFFFVFWSGLCFKSRILWVFCLSFWGLLYRVSLILVAFFLSGAARFLTIVPFFFRFVARQTA